MVDTSIVRRLSFDRIPSFAIIKWKRLVCSLMAAHNGGKLRGWDRLDNCSVCFTAINAEWTSFPIIYGYRLCKGIGLPSLKRAPNVDLRSLCGKFVQLSTGPTRSRLSRTYI
ncbi:hypothetical protein FRC19_006573 [Serendipita sp. 401]|nr:hypothetical protein FRC19_006573 [Serendipita sp. 401]